MQQPLAPDRPIAYRVGPWVLSGRSTESFSPHSSPRCYCGDRNPRLRGGCTTREGAGERGQLAASTAGIAPRFFDKAALGPRVIHRVRYSLLDDTPLEIDVGLE